MVLVHHMPGWDEWYKEATLRFARQGYATLCPNLYFRAGHGTPEDVAAKVRAAGGVPDDQAVGDLEGAARFLRSLPTTNGKVGIFGTCSGGRHAYLTACRVPHLRRGGGLLGRAGGDERRRTSPPTSRSRRWTTPRTWPVPCWGCLARKTRAPPRSRWPSTSRSSSSYGKNYEFHMYPGAGHGFFYQHRPAYRQEQAVDGWNKVFAFLEKYLSTSAG